MYGKSMTTDLEERIDEEALDRDVAGADKKTPTPKITMPIIDPRMPYVAGDNNSRERLYKHFKPLKDAKPYLERLVQKGEVDYDSIKELGGRLHGDSDYYFRQGKSLKEITKDAGEILELAQNALDDHAYINRRNFFERVLEAEEKKPRGERKTFTDMIKNGPRTGLKLYKTVRGDTAHDKLVDIVGKYHEMVEILQEEDQGRRMHAMTQVVAEDMKKQAGDNKELAEILRANLDSPKYIEEHFGAIFNKRAKVMEAVLTPERAAAAIKNSMAIAYRAYEDEMTGDGSDAGDADDLIKGALRPISDQLMQAAYKVDKAERDKEKEEFSHNKAEQNARQRDRRKQGLPL